MSTMARSKPLTHTHGAFEQSAAAVLGDLQAAIADLLAHLPGAGERAVDIQRDLGLDKKRGWQLYKVAKAESPLAEIDNIPGGPTMRRILTAAARRKVPRMVTERAASAYERFEALVDEHGGDRDELASLASGIVPGDANGALRELRVRRTAFKALSHFWGIKTHTAVRTSVFRPNTRDPNAEDLLGVNGNIGLQRLRPGVPLTYALRALNSPAHHTDGENTPLEAAPHFSTLRSSLTRGLQFLEDFSTRPLPDMEQRVLPDASVETDILFAPSGKSGAVTLYAAQLVEQSTKGRQNSYAGGGMVRIPCERIVCELLVPVGLSNPATARVAMYGRRDSVDRVYDCRLADLLPQRETAQYLGVLATAPALPGVPRHAGAISHALARAEWQDTRFDVYRCTVEYPMLHTLIALEVDAMPRTS